MRIATKQGLLFFFKITVLSVYRANSTKWLFLTKTKRFHFRNNLYIGNVYRKQDFR